MTLEKPLQTMEDVITSQIPVNLIESTIMEFVLRNSPRQIHRDILHSSMESGWLIPWDKRVEMEEDLFRMASEGELLVSDTREQADVIPFVRFAEEPFSTSYGSWVFQKGSALQRDFGRITRRLADTGVLAKIRDDQRRERKLKYLFDPKYKAYIRHEYLKSRPQNHSLDVKEIYLPLILLAAGLVASMLSFTVELCLVKGYPKY